MDVDSRIPHDVGLVDMMQVVHELHKRGYEKLRMCGYITPMGSYRGFIAPYYNLNPLYGEPFDLHGECWFKPFMEQRSNADINELIEIFLEENRRWIENARGEDKEYVKWYNEALEATERGKFPVYHDEWWLLAPGKIYLGREVHPAPPISLRLISWNIDGLNARFGALLSLQDKYKPDVICLQKTKCSAKNAIVPDITGYQTFSSQSPYAGVVTYIRDGLCKFNKPSYKETDTNAGHFLETPLYFPELTVMNCYVPYANPNVEGAVEHRQKYDKWLINHVKSTPDRIVMCGDMNIVHSQQDCWDETHERKQANFSDWERKDFDKLLEAGHLADTFRVTHPFSKGEFTYFFRNDKEVRAKNHGHRIDYFLASRSLLPNIEKAEIIKEVTDSTNNPILLDLLFKF